MNEFRMIALVRSVLVLVAAAAFGAGDVTTPLNNDQVRVLSAIVYPGKLISLHDHKINRVMIYRSDGHQVHDYTDGTGHQDIVFVAGEVKWSPASGMHTAKLVSDHSLNIIEIELKKPGNGSTASAGDLDPVKLDPKHYKVELDNDQVRVLRVTVAPHQSVPMHEHALNRVVVNLTDQETKITSPAGQSETVQHKAGDVSWGTPTKHREENLMDKTFEAIIVELKN